MFERLGNIHVLLPPSVGLLALLAAAVLINLIVKHVLVRAVRAFARQSSASWDDALVAHNVFGRLAQVVPALIVFVSAPFVPELPEGVVQLGRRNVGDGLHGVDVDTGADGHAQRSEHDLRDLAVAKDRP